MPNIHPVIKYVLAHSAEVPISKIYRQFPNNSQASIRAALSSGVRENLISRVGYGIYGPPTLTPKPKVTLETINERLETLQYHVAQETIKQVRSTLSKLPKSKHDHKDLVRNVRIASIRGAVATLSMAESIISNADLTKLYSGILKSIPESEQPYFLAFLEHYGKIEPHEPVDPKVLAEVQAWMETMAT